MKNQTKLTPRQKRKIRTRNIQMGTAKRPRLIVFRSNKYIYAQLIDDYAKSTIVGISEKDIIKADKTEKISKTEKAKLVGIKIAEISLKKNIKEIIFDRNGYKFHGRVKSFANGAKEGGLIF